MIISFYPHKDATIYEEFPNRNTEADSILELIHDYTQQKKNNSRILLQFSNEEISTYLTKYNVASASYFLKMNSVTIDELPIDTTLEIYAVSESWNAGNGFFDSNPETTNGVSWKFKTAADIDLWDTNTLNSKYFYVSGGGTWVSESLIKKTLLEKEKDLFIDVTSIFSKYETAQYQNNGILIKYTSSFENSQYPYARLQYFSRNSNTIYSPKLFLVWDDSSFSTGSLTELNLDNEVVLYSKLNQEYNQSDITKIRIKCRPKYIQKTYSTQSQYLQNYYLPDTAYYEVRDSVTNDIVVPLNTTGSKLSCDENGNYFIFDMSNLQQERYYKFVYKIIKDNVELLIDPDQYFKVVR